MASQTPYKQNPSADKAETAESDFLLLKKKHNTNNKKQHTSTEDGFTMKTISWIKEYNSYTIKVPNLTPY